MGKAERFDLKLLPLPKGRFTAEKAKKWMAERYPQYQSMAADGGDWGHHELAEDVCEMVKACMAVMTEGRPVRFVRSDSTGNLEAVGYLAAIVLNRFPALDLNPYDAESWHWQTELELQRTLIARIGETCEHDEQWFHTAIAKRDAQIEEREAEVKKLAGIVVEMRQALAAHESIHTMLYGDKDVDDAYTEAIYGDPDVQAEAPA